MNAQGETAAGASRKMPREVRLTVLLFCFALFGLGIPRVFTATAAETLFIHAYGAEFIPYAYVAQAFLIPLFGHLYVMADEHLTVRKVIVGSMICDFIIHVGLFLGFTFTDFHPVGFAAIVWYETEFVFSSLWLWGLATQLMTLREGKKYFGYIIAGEPVAVIIGGLSTPLVLEVVNTQTLFLISGVGALIGAYICFYITSLYKPQRDITGHGGHGGKEEDEPEQQGAKPWYKERYVQILVALVVVAQAAFFFTDSAFFLEAGKAYPEEEELGAFIGKFMAAVGCVSLLMTLFVSGPLLKRFGLRMTLLLLPALSGVIAFACAFMGLGIGATAAVFWLAFALKTADQAVRYTIDKTSYVALLQPLPASQRTQVQAALESGIEPLVGGISGLALVALVHWMGFGADGIALIVGIFAITWILLVVVGDRYYQGALRSSFQARRFGGGQMTLDDPESLSTVLEALKDPNPGPVLNALSLIDRIENFDIPACYRTLLDHPAPAVREEVLRRIEAMGEGGMPDEWIMDALRREKDPFVRAVALRALSAVDPARAVEHLEPMLTDASEPVRRQAFVGLLRHGGIEGVLCAGESLLALLRSGSAEDRLFGSSILEAVAAPGFGRFLTDLLRDSDPRVRTMAVRAVGEAKSDKLWPRVVDLLNDPELRVVRAATSVLRTAGDAAIDPLTAMIDSSHFPLLAKQRAAQALGQIGSAAASDALIDRLGHSHLDVTVAMLFALPTGRLGLPHALRVKLLEALNTTFRKTGQTLAWRCALPEALPADVDPVLVRALSHQVEQQVRNVFRLVTILYPESGLEAAWKSLRSGDASKQAFALEAIETTLDRSLRPAVLALLEHERDEARLKALPAEFKPQAPLRATDIPAILSVAPASEILSWTRAAALFTLLRMGGEAPKAAPDLLESEVCREMLELDSAGGTMLTIEKVLALRSTPIFRGVAEEHLVDIARRAEPVELEAGTALFNRGEEGNSMFVVVNGRLRVFVGDTTVAQIGAPEVVGEMAAVDPEPRSASVEALEHSLLLRVSHNNLSLLIEQDPDVAHAIIKILCARLRGIDHTGDATTLPAPPGDQAPAPATAA